MGLNCKPGVSRRVTHYVAALIWAVVGMVLLCRGGLFLRASGRLWLLLPAMALGTAKSFFMLDRTAGRNLERLSYKTDGACLGGVYSARMWGVVVAMILLGWLLRHSGLPASVLGCIYVAIGWAMLFSSRLLWRRAIRLLPKQPS